MKYLIIGILSIFLIKDNLIQKDNYILWSSNRKLKFEDFKGKQKEFSFFEKALSTCAIKSKGHINDIGIPVFDIKAVFVTNESWIVQKDSLMLKHEQVHFDIAEVYARKIRKAIDSLAKLEVSNVDLYKTILEKYYQQCDSYNDKYDNDVYTVINDDVEYRFEEQDRWIEKIAKELDELKEYEYVPNVIFEE